MGTYICECNDEWCGEKSPLTDEQWEAVYLRAKEIGGDLYIVNPGHEHLSVYQVVESGEGWVIVKRAQ